MEFQYICSDNLAKELKERVSRLEGCVSIGLSVGNRLEVRNLRNPSPREIKTFTEIMPKEGILITSVTKHWNYENMNEGQIFHVEKGRVYFMIGNPLEPYDEFVIYLSNQENNLRHERS